jgi:plasmid stabilization system protein ParE
VKIKILDEAQNDLHMSAWFYEKQHAGLGAYFLETLFSDIQSLLLYAGIHVRIDGYFRLLSRRFPFAVYYLVEQEVVQVYAVLDCRRNPKVNHEQLVRRSVSET